MNILTLWCNKYIPHSSLQVLGIQSVVCKMHSLHLKPRFEGLIDSLSWNASFILPDCYNSGFKTKQTPGLHIRYRFLLSHGCNSSCGCCLHYDKSADFFFFKI